LLSLGAIGGGARARLTLLFSFTGFMTHTATSIAALKGWYFVHPVKEVGIVVAMVYVGPALLVAITLFQRRALWQRSVPPQARAPRRGAPPRPAGHPPQPKETRRFVHQTSLRETARRKLGDVGIRATRVDQLTNDLARCWRMHETVARKAAGRVEPRHGRL